VTGISAVVTPLQVSAELWATSLLPEGILEEWLRPDGGLVETGDPVAIVRIEDALHELMAPAKGRLSISVKAHAVVEPGTVLGSIIRNLGSG
jgi:pyruvate/2-oxoglutarate dehydrogenase complex dihydrolipoamide acyltransferase (E2) component